MAPRPGAAPDAVRSFSDFAAAEARSIRESTLPSSCPLRFSISSSMWWRSHGCGGELHPVGLFVEADPEPEVLGLDVEFAFHGDDVRRHEQQPAGGGGRGVFGQRGEGIVLAQDLAGEEGQDGAELAAGDGAADAGRAGAEGAAAASSIFSMAGLSITAKLWVLALAQEARSTTRTEESRRSRAASRPVMSWTCGTETSAMQPQVVDGGADLRRAQRRARRASAGPPWTRPAPS